MWQILAKSKPVLESEVKDALQAKKVVYKISMQKKAVLILHSQYLEARRVV